MATKKLTAPTERPTVTSCKCTANHWAAEVALELRLAIAVQAYNENATVLLLQEASRALPRTPGNAKARTLLQVALERMEPDFSSDGIGPMSLSLCEILGVNLHAAGEEDNEYEGLDEPVGVAA